MNPFVFKHKLFLFGQFFFHAAQQLWNKEILNLAEATVTKKTNSKIYLYEREYKTVLVILT